MFKVLAARITVFAFACIWVFGWLLVGITLLPPFTSILEGSGLNQVLANFLVIWYLLTLIIVGGWIAIKGFKFIGKWEKDNEDE